MPFFEIYVFFKFLAALSLCFCVGAFLVVVSSGCYFFFFFFWVLLSVCSVWFSPCSVFSCYRVQALGHWLSSCGAWA